MSQPMAVVLAAGRGTRMKSDLPKVLFPVLGRPMIHWVLDALAAAGIARSVVVVGYRDELVREELAARSGVEFALQSEQLGTGHAVQMCRDQIASQSGPVLVVAGDSPLIQPSSIGRLVAEFRKGPYACLLGTLVKDNPQGLGRIVRSLDGRFERIVEEKDATPDQKQIREVNMSTYLFAHDALLWALSQLGNHNAQGEFYLTDCPALLLGRGELVDARPVLESCEALSINTIDELGKVEGRMLEMGYSWAN
ncbi:MAG: NTP transferase domain-containing protein [Pirellulaceae bacterium]|nr:NTP transferase domain-containing protein [Pirellulaceae bacterium]